MTKVLTSPNVIVEVSNGVSFGVRLGPTRPEQYATRKGLLYAMHSYVTKGHRQADPSVPINEPTLRK